MKKIKCAVIGGSGFLGSKVINELMKLNYTVKNIDISNIANNKVIECDIKNYDKLKKHISDCDYVFHFGGIADISQANKNPINTIKENIINFII